ncbi:MAG: hypothetical protein JWQ43_3625 [Glaciihabitans sp.]|nr:hypothetical protein [Glaciihabitans sp.]
MTLIPPPPAASAPQPAAPRNPQPVEDNADFRALIEDENSRLVLPRDNGDNLRRRRLRRRLLLWSIPFLLAAIVLATWLLSLSATAGLAIEQYKLANFTGSAETAGDLLAQNHVETWIPYFDRGVAEAAGGDYIPAIDDFELALTTVPEEHRCEVIVNLALGWERLADGYTQAGLFDGARLLYQNSADVLAGQDCVPPEEPVDGRDPGQELQDAEARVQSKLDATKYFSEQENQDEASTPEDRLDQLNEQDDAAAEDKAQGDGRDRAESGSGGFADKPW